MVISHQELICPICGKNNHCGNTVKNNNSECWCKQSTMVFPHGLLSQVPAALSNKTCICQRCLRHYVEQENVEQNAVEKASLKKASAVGSWSHPNADKPAKDNEE